MAYEVRIKLFTGTMPLLAKRPPKQLFKFAIGGRVLLWQCSKRLHGHKKFLSTNEPFYEARILCKEALKIFHIELEQIKPRILFLTSKD
jgi:hypothetical protein